ncbi:family 16 glycosylhydrolase [Niabella beijingensis]|uniref:family 16 glycosylhydrolase n=1 Tax=Niabella beijingensis TaxID=2872700 RepID=UPI001CBA7836|nr:family 16 glycosylhydrolase [Niabella beijingensis]MBZ4189124.1 family 16 glycosylhydrolase [Niabella beijingensis]
MKQILLPAAMLMVLLSSFGLSATAQKKSRILFAKNPIVAHRGAFKKNQLPENSIASLRHAIQLKCTGSEFDIQMTSDDSLVINHDPHYNKLMIEETTYAELIKTPLSNGERLPTLREYTLAGLKGNTTTRLVFEIKPSKISKERAQLVAERVVRLVHQLGAAPMAVYISFDYDVCKKVKALDPQAHVQYLNGDKSPEEIKADGLDGVDYHYSVFQKHPDWIAQAKKNHIALNAWTVNTVTEMDWLLANGFEFITTNEPELLAERLQQTPPAKGWRLVWSDEFDGTGLPDDSKWNYDVGGNGWGNRELQYYTRADSNNAVVKNGKLIITARKEQREQNSYTSARLVTKGKGDWQYGRVEVSAKLPSGKGTWPAIWMLPTNGKYGGWPASGEIDIMEHVGYNPDTVYSSVHTKTFNHVKGTQKTKGLLLGTADAGFHLYAIEWTKNGISFFVDDQPFFSFRNSGKGAAEWPFDQPFHLLLNIAMGGNWGGKYGVDENLDTAIMEVEYVRVFQK